MRSTRRHGMLGYLTAAVFLVLWWEVGALSLGARLLPTPYAALLATGRLLQSTLGEHLWVSLYRVVLSVVISLVLGVPLGLLMGWERSFDRVLAPLVYLTYPVPKIVFLPLILVFLGLGDGSKIFLITLVICYQIVVTTRDAVHKVPPESVFSLRSLGASRWQVYRYVLFPACLPDVLTALRLSMGTAIAVLFFAESFATTRGLGYFIMDAWSRAAPDEMFAGIIVMGLLGAVMFLTVDFCASVICRWQRISSRS